MKSSRNLKSSLIAGRVVAFFIAAGLSACNHADGGKVPDESQGKAPEVTLSFDAAGNIAIKDKEGKPVGDQCSPDPKSPNACPIFKPGHKVQVEQALYIQGIRYHGSPQCMVLLINGAWYVLPSASFCSR